MNELKTRDVMLRILLTILTCGLYGLYWQKTITDDIHRFSERPQTPTGLKSVLLTLVTCSLYFYYWLYKISGELVEARREKGLSLDPVSNATYVLTIVLTSLLALGVSILQTMADIPEGTFQDLSEGETIVAGLVAFLIVGIFCFVVQTVIAAGILWIVYQRKDPNPRILYMLLAIFRTQILTIAFLQASLNDAISIASRKEAPPMGPAGGPTNPVTVPPTDALSPVPSAAESAVP